MPLNKLENFIKNTEGRILYVNPNDLDATDGIENQGNSLTKPFKTIQRALLESARFSYLRGDDNDIVEKTTILLYPGEHLIDNRPGYAIKDVNGTATAVAPGGAESFAGNELTLTLDANFDLTQEDNILHKFNSIYGGIIIPRGTSLVGLDLRKTKIRPKYIPNPTDEDAPHSAIFRITGACYFWQFSIFDGDESGTVYTDPRDFSENNRSKPTFSHHKLTVFEYADGVNLPAGYALTDLDMYYSKLSNAYNRASGREIDQKYPSQAGSFAKQRPEWEIVGAFAADPITITGIISGDGATPGSVVTVTTSIPHGFSAGTPIKIRGINVSDYNISTKVTQVISDTVFTYSLSDVRANLPAGPAAGLAPGANATATIETDTVTGASPYIFNISLRSVFGMQGMHADGSKADGFRSMVVAQYTAVSLQKDDRAFVKYNESNRTFDSISITKVTGAQLAAESSATNDAFVYHLDSDAVYRQGWKTTHIKMSNDSVIQVVSVFAIGFHKHFEALSGGDASITNSNSNFGQFSLAADGFKADAFDKDDKGYVTSIVAPKSIAGEQINVEWVQFDISKTNAVGINNHLYLLGYSSEDIPPPVISQGYRIGARVGEKLYLDADTNSARILMTNGPVTASSPAVTGSDSSVKLYNNVTLQNNAEGTVYTVGSHNLQNGESVRVISETGDLPEGLEENVVYFAVTHTKNTNLAPTQIQLASSRTNAEALDEVTLVNYGGEQLRIESRVSDKKAGELGHPLQYDSLNSQWFIHTDANSSLFQYITSTITSVQYGIAPSDGQTHNVGGTSYPVQGRLYVPTSVSSTSIDVVVVFHGTLADAPATTTIADASLTALNQFLDQNNLNVRDKIIFSAAYPQDNISLARNLNISGTGASTFLLGDNLPYARAAVGWVQNSLNGYLATQGVTKTIGNVFLFGHSQGGKLVAKINTLDTGIAGVIANAPGPIQLDQTCAADPSNTSCTKIAAIHGASSGDGSSPYNTIGLESYTSTHNAPILFTQALDDGTGGGNQAAWLQDYFNAIQGISSNATSTLTTVATGGHAAFTTDATLQAAIRTFLSENTTTLPEDSEISYFKRLEDDRSLDEKLYKIRYVVPKDLSNGRDPVAGFVLQDSSSTNIRQDSDFNATSIDTSDYDFNRNVRFISSCTFDSGTSTIEIRSEQPHGLKVNDKIFVENVTSTTNTPGTKNVGYNGTFTVEAVSNDKVFSFDSTDVFGTTHNPGTITNNTDTASNQLPRFTRKDVKRNYYIYRVETIKSYVKDVDDGVYYLYALNADASLPQEFTADKYSQNVTDLYPQLDRDNFDDNPPAAKTFAKRFPLGDVVTNDLKRSITRENTDMFLDTFGVGFKISSVSGTTPAETLTFDRQHDLNRLVNYNALSGGSGHVDGTYRNVRLFNDNSAPASAIWDGATADVTVSGGAVTAANIVAGGSGYTSGETLYFDSSQIGGSPNANVTTNAAGISTAEHNYVQVTGIGTTAGGYFRVNSTINSTTAVSIAKTAGDPMSAKGQIVLNLGIAMKVTQVSYTAATGITRFTTATSGGDEVRHGLLKGNSFRILDNANNNLGDFVVSSKINLQQFEAKTDKQLSTTDFFYILKHGMSANDASADASGENFGARNLVFYDNEQIQILNDITTEEQFRIYRQDPQPYPLADVPLRFPLGTYVQVDNEIMRIKSNALTGTNSDEIQVIRGSMGTLIESHAQNSVVKKIKLLPIESHRPSILRASGHTFEYLGYGPGNYSTGLPQVQVKTLTEDEEFLSQSQETSCGTVLYTGMDSDGDFYIGNTKYSSQSGEQTVFDVPVPTITGEDPNRLSVVFDEVIVKERILVEGGSSQQILSQFDGPVTFNADTRFNAQLIVNSKLRVTDTVDFRSTNNAISCDDSNAALRVLGGVGIAKDVHVCGTLNANGLSVQDNVTVTNNIVAAGGTFGNIQIAITNDNTIDTTTGNLILNSAGGTLDINDNVDISGTLDVAGETAITDTLRVRANNEQFLVENSSGQNQFVVDTDNGNTFVRGELEVDGNIDHDGAELRTAGKIQIDNTDNASSATGNNGSLGTNGGISCQQDLHVGGTIFGNVNGNVTGTLTGTASQIQITNTNSGTRYLTFTADHVNGSYALRASDRYYVTPSSTASSSELQVRGDIIAFAAAASDDKLKTNKINITGALDKVNSLTGFTFEWNEVADKVLDLGGNPGRQLGVSAQEVQKVAPEAVKAITTDKGDEFLSVKYEKLVPLLIESIKELSAKVSALEDRLNN